MLILLLGLALTVNESPLRLIYLPTDFIRLLGNLLNRVSPKLVHEVLEEEPELTREVLIPLLFISLLPLRVNRAQVLVSSALLIGNILWDCLGAWAWLLAVELGEAFLAKVEGLL